MDGYCPLAAYLGVDGFSLELALRPGVQHLAKETDFNPEHVTPMAQRLSTAGPKVPILPRLARIFHAYSRRSPQWGIAARM